MRENRIKLGGYGNLMLDEQLETRRMLRDAGTAFRLSGRGADQGITLLNVSAKGVIPEVVKAIMGLFGLYLN